ncbi:protein of unknown function [Tenacibaculum sp. 190524A02b]|uniref:hypothetical protein n=1 Tax=Tenacibaculum vairaonense TaxID=3137860 RepID=UPI0032B23A3D
MSEKDKQYNLKYIPIVENGTNLFEGIPCPTKEVHDLLGVEGVNSIKQKINTVLSQKKETIETDSEVLGLPPLILFKDIQTDIVFKVGLTLRDILKKPALNYRHLKRCDFELYQTKLHDHIPELIIPEKYKVDNYELLNNTDHYLIRKFINDDSCIFNENFSDTILK